MTPHETPADVPTFHLLLRKPGRPWHVAARSKSHEVAVLAGEQMRADHGYEYEVRPAGSVVS